jgi:hypothetical protein
MAKMPLVVYLIFQALECKNSNTNINNTKRVRAIPDFVSPCIAWSICCDAGEDALTRIFD